MFDAWLTGSHRIFHAECRNRFERDGQLDQRMQSLDRGLAALRRNNQIHGMR
jgi:hypothetical protein